MKKQIITTQKAPAAIGPYSQGLIFENFVYTSGQLPINPVTGLMPDSIEEQTEQAMKNVKEVLESAGSSLDKSIKFTLFIRDMKEFGKINGVYGSFFAEEAPCRSVVEVSALPKDALVEIEAVAYK